MAARKQFLTKRSPNPELMRLLDEARTRDVSEEDLREQRISFAYGNAPPSDLITKESVRKTSQQIRLRRD